MKLKNNLSSYEINRLLSDAWLNVNVDDSELWNPLSEIPPSLEDDPQLYITWLMMQPEYMSFVCSQIFNIEIFPLQGVILSQLWQHKFPMLIASRGASKSSSLAIYSLLRMLLLPGRKIILCGAGFRQSKLIFDYMENIWNNSPLLRDMCRGPQQGPQHGTDVWSFRIGESVTKAIPIGCLSEDSLVTTSDGIVSLKDLQNTKTKIWGNSKYRDIGFFYDSGIVPSIKVKTKKGYEYIGTPNHKMKIVRDNSIKWIRTDEMKIGDKIIIDRTNRWHNGDSDASIDDAYCLGVMIGDGNYTNKYYLRYTTIDEDTFIPILNKTIGVFKKQKDHHYQLNGKDKVHEWLDFWGMQHTYTKDKSLPKKILCSNKEKMTACLQGLFDTDGSIQSVKSKDGVSLRISFTNTSKKLIEQIHYILLHYGIISTLTYRDRLSPRTGNPALRCYDLYINGENAYKFYKNIGFRMKRKSDALLNAINNKTRFNSIEDEIAGTFDFFKQNYPIMVKNNIKPTFHKLRKFNILNKNLPNSILELCNENHYYDEIKEIEKSIDRPMYDINVPDGNEYCANGFFSHNTGEKIRGQRANDIICVSKDTLIQTDKGLVEIKDYIDGNEYKVMNDIYKFEYPSHIMITKPTDVYKITTIGGYTLKCSEFHQVMTTNGWKKGCELTKDDYVYIDSNDFFPENYYKYQDIILNENLAWTMGVMIAEGHIAKRNEISITNTDYSLIERLKNQNTWSWHEYYRPQYKDKRGFNCKESWTLKYTCTEFREKLYKMGLDYTVHKDKKIPKCILQSPKSVVLSFLSGLFEGDGTAFTDSNNHIYMAYYSTSYNLCHQIQTLLLKFGIYSSLNKRTSNLSDKDQWILRVNGENGYNLYKLLNIKKWNLDTSKISYRTKKSSITEKKYKNKTKYILSTWLGNKNIYIGTYNSKQQCDESFEEFWKTQRKAIRIKSIEKLQDKEALYDFHMPESHSFIGNGFVNHNCDEFDAINRDIFETVIAGFAAVSSNPIDAMKHEARKKLAKEIGFQLPKQQKDEVDKPNQIIISGTAGYEFNHFCQYWRKWKQFILSNGDEKELNQLFNGKVPIDFDHKDYCILRLPIELIPRGFMDPAQIARSKATLHSGIFQMEFSAVFSKDSSGFFKRSLIESCTASPDNSIVINGSSIVYGPKVRGDKKARYVFGVDPASEVDKFSIVILEVHSSHRRIVYCWTTNKKEHRERIRAGITKETDFYSFCARKIRDLMKVFPCERIAIDAQGGGYPIIECLHNKNLIEYDEKPLWPIINPDKSQDSDGEYGDHIINVIQFTDYKWTSEANHSLRLDFESKKCLFPYKDTMDVAIAMGEKELSENLYDTLEDCIFDIEELKNELSYIVITKTNSGRDRWDTPEMKLPGNKKGRLRKDRYSALVMANMIARNLEADSGPINYDTQADWSRKGSKDDNGPKMIGPQWAIDSLGNLYD